MIPKNIWIAWHQGAEKAPPLVQACIKSWKRNNQDWKINILSQKDWPKWLPRHTLKRFKEFNIDNPAHQADWLRLHLLNVHGGIWVDSTALCATPLNDWIPACLIQHFFAFRNPGPDRVLSNWFIASVPSHPLLNAWINSFEKLLLYNRPILSPYFQNKLRDKFIKHWEESPDAYRVWCHPLTHLITGHFPYFAQHYSFANSLRRNKLLAQEWSRVPAIEAEPCHWLQNHAHESPSEELIRTLRKTNVHKLSRHTNRTDQPMIQELLISIGKYS